jgi:hypothetical protein
MRLYSSDEVPRSGKSAFPLARSLNEANANAQAVLAIAVICS